MLSFWDSRFDFATYVSSTCLIFTYQLATLVEVEGLNYHRILKTYVDETEPQTQVNLRTRNTQLTHVSETIKFISVSVAMLIVLNTNMFYSGVYTHDLIYLWNTIVNRSNLLLDKITVVPFVTVSFSFYICSNRDFLFFSFIRYPMQWYFFDLVYLSSLIFFLHITISVSQYYSSYRYICAKQSKKIKEMVYYVIRSIGLCSQLVNEKKNQPASFTTS